MMDPRAAIAFHEAGHVVAALAHGFLVYSSTCIPNQAENYSGLTREAGAHRQHRGYRTASPVVAFAGPWAQTFYENRNTDSLDLSDPRFSGDLADAERDVIVIAKATGQRAFDLLAEAMDTARELAEDRWGSIVELGADLLLRGTLDGEYIHKKYSQGDFISKRANTADIAASWS